MQLRHPVGHLARAARSSFPECKAAGCWAPQSRADTVSRSAGQLRATAGFPRGGDRTRLGGRASSTTEGGGRMPQTASVGGRVRGGASRARHAGQGALDRLTQSVEAAEVALKDLRKELSKGSRDVLGDLETTLKHARKDLRSVRSIVAKDLAQIEQALVTGKPVRR